LVISLLWYVSNLEDRRIFLLMRTERDAIPS
jgi:hypothetical protein